MSSAVALLPVSIGLARLAAWIAALLVLALARLRLLLLLSGALSGRIVLLMLGFAILIVHRLSPLHSALVAHGRKTADDYWRSLGKAALVAA